MSNGQGPVHVSFPREMKVYSPETNERLAELREAVARLGQMMDAGFVQTNESIQVLHRLPGLVEIFQREMARQLAAMAEQEMETLIAVRSAAILAANKKIEVTRGFQSKIESKLIEDLEEIQRKYEKLRSRVKQECEDYVRGLDSHAFDILDTVFPEFEEPLKMYWNAGEAARAHLTRTANVRQIALDEGLRELQAPVERFLQERRAFSSELTRLLGGDVTDGWYELPFLLIEFEDVGTGATSIELVGHPSVANAPTMSTALAAAIHRVVTREAGGDRRQELDGTDRAMIARALAALEMDPADVARFQQQPCASFLSEEVRG